MTATPVPVLPPAGLAGHLDTLDALTMDGHFYTARLLLTQLREGVSVPGLDELASAMEKLDGSGSLWKHAWPESGPGAHRCDGGL